MPKKMTEIAFIDPTVSDGDVLLAGLRPGVEGILLTAAEPAPPQMARALAGRRDLETVHVIAHGAPGEVRFASGRCRPTAWRRMRPILPRSVRGLAATHA